MEQDHAYLSQLISQQYTMQHTSHGKYRQQIIWHGSVGGVCDFLGSVSSQQKIWSDGWTSVTAQFKLWTTVIALLQLSFICQAKENASLKREGGPTQKKWREERGSIFGSSFYLFFLLPLSLPYVNWASQEGCLLHLRFSLLSSDLPWFYFLRLFSFFVF